MVKYAPFPGPLNFKSPDKIGLKVLASKFSKLITCFIFICFITFRVKLVTKLVTKVFQFSVFSFVNNLPAPLGTA